MARECAAVWAGEGDGEGAAEERDAAEAGLTAGVNVACK